MQNRVRYKTFDQISFADMMVYSKLPDHSFWSHVEKKIDFSFADPLCSVLYSGRGQHPYAPSLKLKIHLIQAYNDLPDRLVEEKIIGDLFIKRFLGLPVDFFGFDHSTIGLDRSRMGTAMFQACHLYILAQMHSLGLWGDKDEQWIIDSFPTNVAMARVGAYRLIQQGMIRIFQHLKRSHRDLFRLAEQSVVRDAMLFRLSSTSSASEQILAFSKLVAQAYGLLQWFQLDDVAHCFQTWPNKNAQQKSVELQAMLKRILKENSRIESPDDDSPHSNDDQGENESAAIAYEKIPGKDRPKNQIISVTDPDARVGKKNYTTTRGYKTQNLCTAGGVILDTKVIPAMEHDRDAMVEMIQGIQSFFKITPSVVLGDTAYGHGKQRVALASLGITTVAPVVTPQNPTGLFDISRFSYDRENDVYLCPNNKTTVRKNYNSKSEGWQHFFKKTDCAQCPLRLECTTNKSGGRSVFHSDYYDLYITAKTYNASEYGKEEYKLRYRVERKNQELKNDCGLGEVQTRSKKAVSMKAKLAAIVVNLKHTVRRLFDPSPGFIRRARTV